VQTRLGQRKPVMPKRILVIQGHPDSQETHLCHGLASAYVGAARDAGHSVDTLKVAELDFPFLRMEADFNQGMPVEDILVAQGKITQAEHIVIFYPLWLGAVPAILQAFFEQVFRPDFAFSYRENAPPIQRLKGKSAHVNVTMGMPSSAYRWIYRAHSLKALERNLLKFCGIGPVRKSLFGRAKTAPQATREKWLAKMREAGRQAW
jgi:putative NADPH-quinone reductase